MLHVSYMISIKGSISPAPSFLGIQQIQQEPGFPACRLPTLAHQGAPAAVPSGRDLPNFDQLDLQNVIRISVLSADLLRPSCWRQPPLMNQNQALKRWPFSEGSAIQFGGAPSWPQESRCCTSCGAFNSDRLPPFAA